MTPSPEDEPPLDPAGTADYLRDWLGRWDMAPDSFSEAEIRQIHRVSGGDPDRIERLAAQHFQDPALLGERNGPRLSPGARLAAITAVIVAAVILGSWLWPAPRHAPVSRALELPPAPAQPARNQTVAAPASTPDVEPAAPAPPPVPAANTPPPGNATVPGVRTADWLEAEDGNRYVLQLIGATEMRTIDNYLGRAGIPERRLTLVNTVERGRPWHILIYGLYDSPEAAREDGKSLPPYARDLKPWPRRVADVRAEKAAP